MNKFVLLVKLPVFIFLISLCTTLYSTTWTVTVQDFSFNPSSLSVNTSDTIKWQWISGSHTTTSLTVPAGASTWDTPINQTTPTFKYVVTTAGNYTYKCTPHYPMMQGTITANPIGIQPIGSSVPESFNLYQNYPNPFNPSTRIKFDIPSNQNNAITNVKLIVYDILGNELDMLVNESLSPGTYEVSWSADKYSTGIYIYKLEAQRFSETKRMILLK